MINLDFGVVGVALPSIARGLHAGFATMEWILGIYALVFAAVVLPAGALADIFGRKRMLIAGLTLFCLGTLLSAIAPNASTLIAARAIEGVGAAFQLSSALAILSHEFRGTDRAHAFAFWGSIVGLATMFGPLAAGLSTQLLGRQGAFFLNVPIGAAILFLASKTVTESRNPRAANIDVLGSLTFAATLFLLTYALISGNHLGWSDIRILAALGASLALAVLFIVTELNLEHPMLELHFFARPTFLGANLAGIAYAAASLTMMTYLPLFFQAALGSRPLVTGLLMLPIAAPLFFVPRIMSRYFAHKVSGRLFLTVGLLLVSVGMAFLGLSAGSLRYALIAPGLLIAGVGAGILNGETARVGVSAIPAEKAGMSSGISGTVRFTGVVLGFAALGALLAVHVQSGLADAGARSEQDLRSFTQTLASGNLAGAAQSTGLARSALERLFVGGFQEIFTAASVFALASAIGCWFLISSIETGPASAADDRAVPID